MSGPILVIGLDGATFDLILPMVARGELPAFARLMRQGAWGRLQSTLPPVSPQAWSSFLTGMQPGSHGIFGFLGAARGDFYQRPILSAKDIQAPTFLQIAGEAGLRVAALDVPMTYPPRALNGIVVPEQHGPPLSQPPGIWDEMVQACGDPRDSASHIPSLFSEDKRSYVARQFELLEIQRKATHWLLDREAFDLSVAVFTHSDRMGHFLWKFMDASHPQHDPAWAGMPLDGDGTLGQALPELYRRLDAIVAELWQRLGPHGTLLVMSDHGFGPIHQRVFLNHWLLRNGYLAVRPLVYRLGRIRYPWQVLRLFNGAARRLRLPHLALPIGPWQGPINPALYDPRFFFDPHLFINWKRTRVYCGNSAEQGIFINMKGRQPHGVVEPGAEYEALRSEIRQQLQAMTDPSDGEPLFEHVWLREECYQGPFLEHAPDLVVQTRAHIYALSPELFSDRVVAPSLHITGTHRPQGICLLAGPGIQPGSRLEGASIVDLAPTLLHLAGIPIPEHMEGSILEQAFTTQWLRAHPVRRLHFSGSGGRGDDVALTPEETAALEAHLRSLGYLS